MADPAFLTAYAHSLGTFVAHSGDGPPILAIDFARNVEGRPGAFHGGATSGLLETAGYAALRNELELAGREHTLKPINITVQFLLAGREKRCFAQGRVTRLGRRNANIEVQAWQEDRDRPIATAVMNVLMAAPRN
jgi:uncharacterized protein (TIGR00369 family)